MKSILLEIQEIYNRLKVIEQRLNMIPANNTIREKMIDVPDHLYRAYHALCAYDEATAEMVATRTGRARAVESSYLNQLCNLGLIEKYRRKRQAFFRAKPQSLVVSKESVKP